MASPKIFDQDFSPQAKRGSTEIFIFRKEYEEQNGWETVECLKTYIRLKKEENRKFLKLFRGKIKKEKKISIKSNFWRLDSNIESKSSKYYFI